MRAVVERRTMIGRLAAVLAGLTAVLGVLAAGGSAAPSPAEFSDPAGDSGPGPDITRVAVSADDAGILTFRIEIPNRPNPEPDFVLGINIDADNNAATGNSSLNGIDYMVIATATGSGVGRWNGSTFEPTQSAVSASYASGVTLTLPAAEIGGSQDFRFWVGTWDDEVDPANWDAAPGAGYFPYSLTDAPAPPAPPSITRVMLPATALLPKAGKTLTVRGIQIEIDGAEIVTPETVACTLKVARRTIAPLGRGCRWRIPTGAAGKRGTLIVTLGYEGATVTQRYPLKVGR
jgi:hypothetical protein